MCVRLTVMLLSLLSTAPGALCWQLTARSSASKQQRVQEETESKKTE